MQTLHIVRDVAERAGKFSMGITLGADKTTIVRREHEVLAELAALVCDKPVETLTEGDVIAKTASLRAAKA